MLLKTFTQLFKRPKNKAFAWDAVSILWRGTVSQFILEDITDEDYAIWMKRNVLKPWDRKASTFKQPLPKELKCKATAGYHPNGDMIDGKWHVYPEKGAAGLRTNPTDLATFLIAMFKISQGRTDYPINKKIQDEMFQK